MIKKLNKSSFQALLILAVVGLWIASGYIFPAATKDKTEEVKNETPRVRVEKSESNERQKTLQLIGVTKPDKEVEIKAEVAGKVEKIYAKEGNPIKQGDVILTIEKRNKQARVSELRALVEQKQISYDASERLVIQGYQSKSGVAKAKSELESAKAQLIQAEIDLKSTTLRAPFSGILEKVYVEEGDFVQVGFGGDFNSSGAFSGVAVAKIISNSPFKIAAGASERVAAQIKEGSRASVKLITGESTEGVVTYVSKVSNPQTRTFDLEVTVTDPKINAASGVTATIELGLNNLNSHKIPSSALTISEEGQFGIKVLVDGKATKDNEVEGNVKFIPVNISDSDETGVWVNDLPEDIFLITLGQNFVNDNAKAIGVLYNKDKL